MAESFSKEERAAMRELAKERKRQQTRSESLAATLERIDAMEPGDRELALKVHEIALKMNPDFEVKTWYGMPAYYQNGEVILFFQDGHKFKTRYSTVGFQQAAQLDKGKFWPTSFALVEFNAEVEKQLSALIAQALGR
jgi:uncharacterized protein YdhG (YjbR/CyaY superfamily)